MSIKTLKNQSVTTTGRSVLVLHTFRENYLDFLIYRGGYPQPPTLGYR